ncbi:hypothetical protein GOP47_0030049 [Adiantum capillus-veneris]|nr:hypothetical protein GOP47_0030049 [Adiantum capillus-veneris]
MLAEQAQRLLPTQVSSRDEVTAFHGTCSLLPGERALTRLGGCSSQTFSPIGPFKSTSQYRQIFLASQNAVRGSSFCTQTLISKGKVHRASNGGWLQPFSTQKRSLTVFAAQHDAVRGLELGDCEVASGSIHLIVGPMFAGKTTALLQRVEEEASAGRNVALVKSDKDTRYGLSSIVSHDGRQMPCWAVPSLASFRSQIGEDEYAKLDLIGIDEAQFLKDLYSFCQIAADYEGKTLIVAGLDGDFQRNKFGSVLDLVPLADSIIKLSSNCELCGKPASFTFRKTDDSNKEVIGGTDIYMPVCRQHYYSGKVALEATRTVLKSGKIATEATRTVLNNHEFLSLQSEKADKSTNTL